MAFCLDTLALGGGLVDAAVTNCIRFCSWNIRGLDNFKLNQSILGNYFKKFDLIMLSETWSSGQDNFHLEGYTFIDFNRSYKHPGELRYSGGLGIFGKDNIYKGVTVVKNHKDNIGIQFQIYLHFHCVSGGLCLSYKGN